MRNKQGFTLVELLIASSIATIIILSLYSAFQTGISSYKRADSVFEVSTNARIAFNRIELDLKNSFQYTQNDSHFKGTAGSMDFISLLDTYANGKLNPDICRIKYELVDGILRRYCYKGIDSLKKVEALTQLPDEICGNVKALSFRYAYATRNPSSPYEWQESWPEESQLNLVPIAVKITLTLQQGEKRGDLVEFNKTVPLEIK
ncbi:MAG: type II secretion system protein GspJ [Candidatus Omnitrophota bacterium]